MKTYISSQVMRFGPGDVLGLTDAQAAARAGSVRPVAGTKGQYTVTGALELKAGEPVGLAVVPKRLRDTVTEVQAETARKRVPVEPTPGSSI